MRVILPVPATIVKTKPQPVRLSICWKFGLVVSYQHYVEHAASCEGGRIQNENSTT